MPSATIVPFDVRSRVESLAGARPGGTARAAHEATAESAAAASAGRSARIRAGS